MCGGVQRRIMCGGVQRRIMCGGVQRRIMCGGVQRRISVVESSGVVLSRSWSRLEEMVAIWSVDTSRDVQIYIEIKTSCDLA